MDGRKSDTVSEIHLTAFRRVVSNKKPRFSVQTETWLHSGLRLFVEMLYSLDDEQFKFTKRSQGQQ